jgi:hypothetical protein
LEARAAVQMYERHTKPQLYFGGGSFSDIHVSRYVKEIFNAPAYWKRGVEIIYRINRMILRLKLKISTKYVVGYDLS